MATLANHIYKIRTALKQHSDDTYYSDQYLYELLLDSRAVLIDRELGKHKPLSRSNFTKHCLDLLESSYHECGDCIPVSGCMVLKANLPKFIQGVTGSTLKIRLLNGATISPASPEMVLNLKYSKVRKNKASYWITGNSIFIFNHKFLKSILVEGIFYDPTEFGSICDDVTDDACKDILESEFNLEPKLNRALYQLVAQDLSIPMSLLEDTKNDSADAPVQGKK